LYKPDYVCNLAAKAGVRASLEDPIDYCKVNIEGNIHLLEECVKNNVKKYVYASSSSVYGLNSKLPFHEDDQINLTNRIYACTKKSMEDFCQLYHRLYGLPVIGLRFFTVYGPQGRPDMAPYKFLKAIINDKEIYKYGDGSSTRDYTYIDDITDGIIGAIFECNKNCEIYNLGSGCPISLNEFIKTCELVCNKKAKIIYKEDQLGDVPSTYADISKAKKDFGYNPKTNLISGLKKTYEWIINNQEINK
jgi:UDP-glucuronate 4-epimerase